MSLPRWFALLALLSFATFAAEPQPYGAGTVGVFAKAPTIDGKLEPGEWDGALATTGFQGLFSNVSGKLDARSGTTWIGYSADRLYIAIRSAYPPTGKLHASGTNRDKDYVGDESVEIWLDPNRDNRQQQQGDLRFYQMNANAQGGIYDIAFDPKSGPDTGWNGNWEFANQVDLENFVWVAEISIPFADLGWKPGTATGRTLGVLVSRNFKAPWNQATSFPVLGAFVDWYRYAAIQLTADQPSVRIESLGEKLHQGELQLRAKVHNPGPARQAKVRLHVTTSDMPEIVDEKLLDLPAGGDVPYTYDALNQRLHEDAQHEIVFTVSSADGATTHLYWRAKWTKAPEKIWHYRIGPDPDAAVRHAYYPSRGFVRLLLDTRELSPEAEKTVKQATVGLAGPAGEVWSKNVTWEQPPFDEQLAVGDLTDGEYTLTIKLDGWPESYERRFTRRHFPWEGNRLGITDAVIAPFTPIAVKGNTVSVVYRDYTLGALGLPSSIRAAGNVSAGGPEELLAAPIALVANGQPLAGTGAIAEQAPNAVLYRGEAATPAVTVRSSVLTEVDGCLRVELTLAPGATGEELKAMYLDIPLRDELMPLWHVTTTGLRINPAGFTPAGQGRVWDSSKFPDGNWFGNFKCYLWLGGDERGLAWFADNDAGWVHALDKKGQPNGLAQELIRQDGVLTLRVNLVQAPITLTEPRTIVFGLMASPAKPMRPDWRLTGITVNSTFNMGYATPATYCAKLPWGRDFFVADWAYARRTGKPTPTKEEIEAWRARVFPETMDPEFRASVIKLAEGWVNNFRPGIAYMKMYFEEFHTTAAVHDESHVFQSEWTGRWHTQLLKEPTVQGHKMFGIGTGGIVDSYRDFAAWASAEWAKRGVGSYFDNAFPLRSYDVLTTSAYKLPNGQIQPSAGIWARRAYLKRIWNIHRTEGPADAPPTMMIHMTNTHILPYMGWNDENLDLEWKFGPEPQQSKYHHAALRAESIGRQTGNVPWVIAQVLDTTSAEQKAKAERTRFGTMMTHEIRWWQPTTQDRAWFKLLTDVGYGTPEARVWNYWDAGYPVTATDPEAKSLLVRNGDQALLLVCTWNPQPKVVEFTVDTAALGFVPATVGDAEAPEHDIGLFDGQRFALSLEGYDVRFIRLSK